MLVGHNPAFDLSFVHAAARRASYRRNPFHAFTVFDTATPRGPRVRADRAREDGRGRRGSGGMRSRPTSAIYDAEMTAEIFCRIVNRWDALSGSPPPLLPDG